MPANPEIDALLAELLDSGVSPKYVSRLASELDDHYADLEAEARRLGVPAGDAAVDAKLRLGRCSEIAKEFELRPELKSWVYTSRWLERLLRLVGSAYLFVRAPARIVAAGQAVMIRYTAATAAGASVTCGILLLLTAMMPSQSTWGIAFVEHAGAALGAWDIEPRRRLPRGAALRDLPPAEPAAEADVSPRAGARDDGRPTAEPRVDIAPREPAHSGPLFRPEALRLPDELYPAIRPSFDADHAKVILADLEPTTPFRVAERADARELKPIVKTPPVYPIAAARRGIEGYVVVEYTVTRTGTTADPVVVESTHSLFHRAALDAARAFRYSPRVIGGEPVDVRGVRIMIRFELEA